MRKLPVYLIVDTSTSMRGEPIAAVEEGIRVLHNSLRRNPYALEVAYLSVITFATEVVQLVPLTEVALFTPPKLVAKGRTNLGAALELVTNRARVEVQRSQPGVKGDWKPLVFIMSDGRPSDSVPQAMKVFDQYQWGIVVACAAGPKGDVDKLGRITKNVVLLESTTTQSISEYFKWVSSSVANTSRRIEQTDADAALDALPPPPSTLSLVKF